MEKFEDLIKIENKRYSPKEALAYFVVSSKNVMNRQLESHINALKEELLKQNNMQVIEQINLESLEKVINYWSLSVKDVIAYAYIVFNNLLFEDKEISEIEITDMFVYLMRIYSPDNARDFVEKKFNISNLVGKKYE